MEQASSKPVITIETLVNAKIDKVWAYWTEPAFIMKWNAASDDWHTTFSVNDLRPGGKFTSRMEAKDGSFGFEFWGIYDKVEPMTLIESTMGDGRKMKVEFIEEGDKTKIIESFEAETENSLEMQKTGWQAILDNFGKVAENSADNVLLKFEKAINASPEKVFKTMIDKKGYNQWTAPFNETSQFEGTWEKGSKILFIGTDSNGKKGGMVGRIKENRPYEFIGIEYLGLVKEDQEITEGPEVDSWAGSMENYWFFPEGNGTKMVVNLESNQEFMSFFQETWPNALDILKNISEK